MHEHAATLLLETADLLTGIDLPFWLAYGTALGAYRDGGFTPSESDIDLGFLAEDFVPRAGQLIAALLAAGYGVAPQVLPLTRVWAVKARRYGIGVDLVANIATQPRSVTGLARERFNPSAASDVCHVYPAAILESYETVEVFGQRFRVPSPIEDYLLHEYGAGWRTPSCSYWHHSRVEDYLRGVPRDILERYAQDHLRAPV